MESGRFAGFFRNAPFDKRSVLRGFRGFRPPISITPRTYRLKGGFGGLSVGRATGIDGWDAGPAREFFYFFFCVSGFLLKKTVVNDNHNEFFLLALIIKKREITGFYKKAVNTVKSHITEIKINRFFIH